VLGKSPTAVPSPSPSPFVIPSPCLLAPTPFGGDPPQVLITALTPEGNDVIETNQDPERTFVTTQYAAGAAWMGSLGYFVINDIPTSTQIAYDPKSRESTFLTFDSNKSTGNVIGMDGLLFTTQHASRRVVKENLTTNEVSVIVDSFEGKQLNGPHDLAMTRSGTIFFTDPPWASLPLFGHGLPLEQNYSNIFRWDPVRGLKSIDTSFQVPSGIALSPDESKLYIAEASAGFTIFSGDSFGFGPFSDEKPHEIRVFDLDEQGDLKNGRKFVQAPYGCYPEALSFDSAGNLWAAYAGLYGRGGVVVYKEDGTALVTMDMRDNFNLRELMATSVAWGGEDGTTLLIGAGSRTFRMQSKVHGAFRR